MNYLASINWGSVGIVLAILAGLAVIFTVLILVIHKFCAVEENPKIGEVKEKLPGANCGGCGFAGCSDFAKALVEGRATLGNCAVSSPEQKKDIAAVLGVEHHVVDFTDDACRLIENPPHGFGGAMNPCIDCHATMIMRAGEMMTALGYDFVATGEVLN